MQLSAAVSRPMIRGIVDFLQDFDNSGFFVLRTPLLPFEELLRWGEGLKAREAWIHGAETSVLEQVWASDVQVLRNRLRQVVERPEIKHALFVASPSLHVGIDHWKQNPDSKKGLQAERALVRYFERMAGRATPFGLFSGWSTGTIATQGEVTGLSLQPQKQYRVWSRLDFDYLFSLTDDLRRDPSLARELKYWPNSSLCSTGGSLHYIESRISGTKRSHHLVKVAADEYLTTVLDAAGAGATVDELADTIRDRFSDSDISFEEAHDYIQELVNNEVLVSTLRPLMTGGAAFDDIIDQLEALPSGAAVAKKLKPVRERLEHLNSLGLGVADSEYSAVESMLEPHPTKFDPDHLYQVDMMKPPEKLILGRSLTEELLNGIGILFRFAQITEVPDLTAFREAFSARYDQATVPLLEALDEECGLGFGRPASDPSPLIRGLQPKAAAGGSGISDTHAYLLTKLIDSGRGEAKEIVLDASGLSGSQDVSKLVPDSFSVVATVAADSSAAIEAGDFEIYLHGGVGPSAGRMFARFCYADSALDAFVRSHLCEEASVNPGAVYAEVVYLPEGRIGNVLSRPVLRDYEIPYLGRSGASQDHQLPLSDLMVRIDSGRISLLSRRLGREVIPRLTNAHGFMKAPQLAPAYRFLCWLQHQHGVSIPAFWWGPLESLDYLPRVRAGRCVLSPARWRLSKKEIERIVKEQKGGRFLAIQELRRDRGLPRWVLLEEGDNTLVVDLDNPLSIDAFVHVVQRTSQAKILEMYPTPEQLCVTSSEGRFVHELNVPFIRRKHVQDGGSVSPRRPSFATDATVTRRVAPGGEWLYVKLYGGIGALDEILATAVRPLVRTARDAGAFARWFFIRYLDPHPHLRLRFQGQPDTLRERLLPLISGTFSPLLTAGRLWNIQFDTYDREIERYGGPEATSIAEDIFCADSDAVLELLEDLHGDEGLDDRWRVTLLGIDRLLTDCGFDLAAKRSLSEKQRDAYRREFPIGAAGLKHLNNRFRASSRALRALLGYSSEPSPELDVAGPILEQRSRRIMADIVRLLAPGVLGDQPLEDLAASYIHMHVNRMIRSSQRVHELALYDFLFRLYTGRQAIGIKMQKSTSDTAEDDEALFMPDPA